MIPFLQAERLVDEIGVLRAATHIIGLDDAVVGRPPAMHQRFPGTPAFSTAQRTSTRLPAPLKGESVTDVSFL